jgi:hypothetical protein
MTKRPDSTELLNAIIHADNALLDAEEALGAAVMAAYADPSVSWQAIGNVLGISRQAAHERFHHLTDV